MIRTLSSFKFRWYVAKLVPSGVTTRKGTETVTGDGPTLAKPTKALLGSAALVYGIFPPLSSCAICIVP
jgi:hypothetical protein